MVEKATFPESASNSEQARYLYYYGRIKAIQLEYTEALDYLVKSLRKAPSSAIGFRQTVEKLRVTVELLLGNIPERQLFLQQANKEALAPYFELTKGIHIVSFICMSFISPERPPILKNKIHISYCSCTFWRVGQIPTYQKQVHQSV